MNADNYQGTSVYTNSEAFTLESIIGSGREGVVYSTYETNAASFIEPELQAQVAIKVFSSEYRERKEPKIRSMIKQKNRPSGLDSESKFQSIIWPKAVVEATTTGDFLGYTMPLEDLDQADTALVGAKKLDWVRNSVVGLGIAYNLSTMVNKIHQLGHALGDFNHENIIIDDGYIKLIDCDGFDIYDNGNTYSADTMDKRYAPPEGRPDDIEDVRTMDRFCLAVHIFQLLMQANHPFRAIGSDAVGGNWRIKIKKNKFPYNSSNPNIKPPENLEREYKHIPTDLKKLFERCFRNGKYNELQQRPTAKEWKGAIRNVLEIERYQTTSTDTNQQTQTDLSIPDQIRCCFNCGTDIPADEKIEYCYKCGTDLYSGFSKTKLIHCFECGTRLFEGDEICYCHNCGTKIK